MRLSGSMSLCPTHFQYRLHALKQAGVLLFHQRPRLSTFSIKMRWEAGTGTEPLPQAQVPHIIYSTEIQPLNGLAKEKLSFFVASRRSRFHYGQPFSHHQPHRLSSQHPHPPNQAKQLGPLCGHWQPRGQLWRSVTGNIKSYPCDRFASSC